ncbi:MAG TPA: deoxyribodipyrimidine photo-lyase [Candidatus Cloacimonadota bacterium]|mgnify:CR=1 FL=1|nr:deoxyribodipyrimidine photo-lyase [Candidatus Cloacimonadota bacterium]HPT71047.1 deoxyribodipyrimidine photo-lyase [Candidatus Cloacimonadota bacterium]
MIQATRLHELNSKGIARGDYILYWMQQAQRIDYNHALNFALEEANQRNLPLLICFVLTPDFPEANARHYYFMLEGIMELQERFQELHIPFHIFKGDPVKIISQLSSRAAILITDRGYLRIQREWRSHIADSAACRMLEVETDAIIPIELVSDHEEYAARTIRPKILNLLPDFLVEENIPEYSNKSVQFDIPFKEQMNHSDIESFVQESTIQTYPAMTRYARGGARQAVDIMTSFLEHKLAIYPEKHNDPTLEISSGLSPYLHFGQISSLQVALEVLKTDTDQETKWSFLEELIVRRELSLNFTWFNHDYNHFDCLPVWAQKSLLTHQMDKRDTTYSYEILESAETYDPYWNAAQKEMMITGRMHNYMRMYWGKKLIEWIPDPVNAFEFTLYLNNKYALDGRDPNSFAGVAWCFGKHDRPWTSHPIFGNVRIMTSSGLERKFNMNEYIRIVSEL